MKTLIIILFVIILPTQAFCQQGVPNKAQLTDNVGDISYNPATDRPPEFLHGDKNIFWYYGVNTSYLGGKKAITETISRKFKYHLAYRDANGYVTIKFVVNTLGETDRFRVFQVDDDYKQTQFNSALIAQLLTIVKGLDHWIPGKYHGGTLCNSYYYLNFKIINGRIAEMTP